MTRDTQRRSAATWAAALMLCGAGSAAQAACVEPGRLLLSEVYYDAPVADENLEWVELYNAGGTPVVLDGTYSIAWAGLDYTFGALDLVGTIGPGETFVVGGPISNADNAMPVLQQLASPALTLQNSGATADAVALFAVPAASISASTVPIDAVIYGDSNDSMLLDESGAPGAVDVADAASGQSIERVAAGWQIAAVPTPNATTLQPAPSPLVLSEVYYDAPLVDDNLEWVELFNRGSVPIVLDGNYSLGWGGADYSFATLDLSGTIAPGARFVVGGPISSADNHFPVFDQNANPFLTLQNSGATADGVGLFAGPANAITAASVPVDAVIYGLGNDSMLLDESGAVGTVDVGDAASGESIARDESGWQILASPTPGESPLVANACPMFMDGFEQD